MYELGLCRVESRCVAIFAVEQSTALLMEVDSCVTFGKYTLHSRYLGGALLRNKMVLDRTSLGRSRLKRPGHYCKQASHDQYEDRRLLKSSVERV
jgi:hypothetical protein